jgi:hypothetical protein
LYSKADLSSSLFGWIVRGQRPSNVTMGHHFLYLFLFSIQKMQRMKKASVVGT